MRTVVCDRCSREIPEGNGYAFYSSAQMMGMTIGNMLLCETCTASIITEDIFAKRFAPTAVSPGDEAALREAMNAATAAGIAECCRAHGLTATQARDKAKELAMQYWNDPVHGAKAIQAFWTSPGPKRPAPPRTTEKNCATCGGAVPEGMIKCPKCGGGVFDSEKRARPSYVSDFGGDEHQKREQAPIGEQRGSNRMGGIKGFLRRLFGGSPRASADQKTSIHRDALLNQLRRANALPDCKLPQVPNEWTTLTSLVFLMQGAALQEPPENDVVYSSLEVARITGLHLDEINRSNSLALHWGQKVIDIDKSLLPAAYLAHAAVVIDLGLSFLRSDVLPSLKRLASDVGNVHDWNSSIVSLCAKVWQSS